ncbi:MAG TPA: hypothetical protein VK638_10880 [Edaphobacter sp.]|nr:hypothetical protein [Edaphobacter sp.]
MAKDVHVARFIEPMECLPVDKIPEGDVWTYELKLDGYRMVAVKAGGKVTLYSRRGTNLSQWFRYITSALNSLRDESGGPYIPITRFPGKFAYLYVR